MGWAVALMFLMISDKYGSDAAWEILGDTAKSILLGIGILILLGAAILGGIVGWKMIFT